MTNDNMKQLNDYIENMTTEERQRSLEMMRDNLIEELKEQDDK